MYIGVTVPWQSFDQPETTGITWPRLLALGFLVLAFRRIPALLTCYWMMPNVVRNWKEAVFMGYFGPIGVGAIYYLEHTTILLLGVANPSTSVKTLLSAMGPGKWTGLTLLLLTSDTLLRLIHMHQSFTSWLYSQSSSTVSRYLS